MPRVHHTVLGRQEKCGKGVQIHASVAFVAVVRWLAIVVASNKVSENTSDLLVSSFRLSVKETTHRMSVIANCPRTISAYTLIPPHPTGKHFLTNSSSVTFAFRSAERTPDPCHVGVAFNHPHYRSELLEVKKPTTLVIDGSEVHFDEPASTSRGFL